MTLAPNIAARLDVGVCWLWRGATDQEATRRWRANIT